MTEKYYTVEQISQLLKIHPKTLQRYIREGKLRASKVGKSWRISGHDLSIFMESEKSVQPQEAERSEEERIKSSAVVDIRVQDTDDAVRIVDLLTGALNSKPAEYGNSSMHTQYIVEENMLRITLWGGIRFMEVMISAISAFAEQTDE